MRVHTGLAATAFTATAILGGAGPAVADESPRRCVVVDHVDKLEADRLADLAVDAGENGLHCVGTLTKDA
ncbi:hypothetical protein SALBM135S_08505 [Streptomyces alboniger]